MRVVLTAVLVAAIATGGGATGQPLTPEAIVDFFTSGEGAPEVRPGGATRSLAGPAAGNARSVHVGPAGFGSAPAAAPGTGSEPAAAPEAGALDLLITFEHDSARLTTEARRNLDAFVQALGHPALSGLRFSVEGHTDASGPDDYNLQLSESRAAAVVDYLSTHGVDAARLTPRGFGETRPRMSDPGHAGNRRVETRRLP